MRSSSNRDEKGASEDLAIGQETDWAYIEVMTDEEAYRNALADEDNPPLTDEQLAHMRRVPPPKEIRERLGLTQREFSRQFQIALGTLRDWEQGARRPDSAAKAYLRVIEHDPTAVLAALGQSRRTPGIARSTFDISLPAHSAEVFTVETAVPFIDFGDTEVEISVNQGITATSELPIDVVEELRAD